MVPPSGEGQTSTGSKRLPGTPTDDQFIQLAEPAAFHLHCLSGFEFNVYFFVASLTLLFLWGKPVFYRKGRAIRCITSRSFDQEHLAPASHFHRTRPCHDMSATFRLLSISTVFLRQATQRFAEFGTMGVPQSAHSTL